jgi:proline iminopeptidase
MPRISLPRIVRISRIVRLSLGDRVSRISPDHRIPPPIPRAARRSPWLALLAVAGVAAAGATAAAQEAVPGGGLAAGEHVVAVDGVRLWYRVAGTGPADAPPVVFLHGGPGGNSHDFAAVQGPLLEGSLRMVYTDQRGSGRSERPADGAYSIARLVDDLEGLRRAMGAPRISLVAHSFGATLALEYAAKHPERVARLVYVDGLWNAPEQCRARRDRLAALHPAALARVLADTLRPDGTRLSDCELEFRALPPAEREAFNDAGLFHGEAARRLHAETNAASGLRNTGEMSRALFRQGLLEYRFTGHDRVTMPVLVIVGRHDHQGGMEPQRALARLLPRARFVEFEDSGHFPYLEEPQRFAREVVDFLAGPATP